MKPSRGMIPLELLIASLSLCLASIGGLGWPAPSGALYDLLTLKGQALVWLLLLGGPAAVLFPVSLLEWCSGIHWDVVRLDRSCRVRAALVGIQGLCLLYGVYLPLKSGGSLRGLALVTGILIVFCSWSYIENRRVRREIRSQTARFVVAVR
jgi:hypothetical protein